MQRWAESLLFANDIADEAGLVALRLSVVSEDETIEA